MCSLFKKRTSKERKDVFFKIVPQISCLVTLYNKSSLLYHHTLLCYVVCAYREIRANLQTRVKNMTTSLRKFRPGLAIVQVGDRLDSNVYIKMKLKAANEIGIRAQHIQVPSSITERELLFKVSA